MISSPPCPQYWHKDDSDGTAGNNTGLGVSITAAEYTMRVEAVHEDTRVREKQERKNVLLRECARAGARRGDDIGMDSAYWMSQPK